MSNQNLRMVTYCKPARPQLRGCRAESTGSPRSVVGAARTARTSTYAHLQCRVQLCPSGDPCDADSVSAAVFKATSLCIPRDR